MRKDKAEEQKRPHMRPGFLPGEAFFKMDDEIESDLIALENKLDQLTENMEQMKEQLDKLLKSEGKSTKEMLKD